MFQTWSFSIFTRMRSFALFCALLHPFVLFCALVRTSVHALLRAFACFCVRPRLERPHLGNAESSGWKNEPWFRNVISPALASYDSNPYPNRSRIARYNATKVCTVGMKLESLGVSVSCWWSAEVIGAFWKLSGFIGDGATTLFEVAFCTQYLSAADEAGISDGGPTPSSGSAEFWCMSPSERWSLVENAWDCQPWGMTSAWEAPPPPPLAAWAAAAASPGLTRALTRKAARCQTCCCKHSGSLLCLTA